MFNILTYLILYFRVIKLKIETLEKAIRVSKDVREKAKKELGGKLVRKFSKDAVDCPDLGKKVSFLQCYVCPNFIRRYKGELHCKGEKL